MTVLLVATALVAALLLAFVLRQVIAAQVEARVEEIVRRLQASPPVASVPPPATEVSEPAPKIAAPVAVPTREDVALEPKNRLVAILAAAAEAALGQPVRLRFALLLADDHQEAWRVVGRNEIFLSHQLRR